MKVMDDPLDVSAESVEIFPGGSASAVSLNSKVFHRQMAVSAQDVEDSNDVLQPLNVHEVKENSSLKILQKRYLFKRKHKANNVKLQSINAVDPDNSDSQEEYDDQESISVKTNMDTDCEFDNGSNLHKECHKLGGQIKQKVSFQPQPPPVPLPPVVIYKQAQGHDRQAAEIHAQKSPRRHRRRNSQGTDHGEVVDGNKIDESYAEDGDDGGSDDYASVISLPKLSRKRQQRRKPLFLKLQEAYDERENENERKKLEKYRQDKERRGTNVSIKETVEAHQAHYLELARNREIRMKHEAEQRRKEWRQAEDELKRKANHPHRARGGPLLVPSPVQGPSQAPGIRKTDSTSTEDDRDSLPSIPFTKNGPVRRGSAAGRKAEHVVKATEDAESVESKDPDADADMLIEIAKLARVPHRATKSVKGKDESEESGGELVPRAAPVGGQKGEGVGGEGARRTHAVIAPLDSRSRTEDKFRSTDGSGSSSVSSLGTANYVSPEPSGPDLITVRDRSGTTVPEPVLVSSAMSLSGGGGDAHDWVSALLAMDSDEEKLVEIYETGFSLLMMEQD